MTDAGCSAFHATCPSMYDSTSRPRSSVPRWRGAPDHPAVPSSPSTSRTYAARSPGGLRTVSPMRTTSVTLPPGSGSSIQ